MKQLELFFFILLAFSSLLLLQSKFEKSNPLYNFQGQCDADDAECLPYSNISFQHIWSGLTQKQIKDKVNAFIKANTPAVFKRKIFVDESRQVPGTLGLFSEQEIDFNDTIASFNEQDIFSNNYNYKSFKNPLDGSLTQFPQLPFKKQNQNYLIMSLNLLYHFYNFDQSPLKDELISYPSKIDIPAFTLSDYELSLLKTDDAYHLITGLRSSVNNDYQTLITAIKEHWTSDHISKFTNGKTTISKDDYVYAISILLSRSFTDRFYKGGENNDELFVSLAPVVHLAKLFKEKVTTKQIPYAYYYSKKNKVKYTSNEFYEKNDEIQQDYNDVSNMFLLVFQKFLSPKNPYDCISLYFMDQKLADSIASACVNEKSIELNQYYLTCNLMNMNEKEQNECQAKTEAAQGDIAQQVKIMFEKCPHPKWENYDLFETARGQIHNKFFEYEQALKKTEEYLYLRQKDKLSKENGLLIKYYLKEKLDVVKGIVKRFDTLDEISGTLKKLNSKLEDKLKKEGKWKNEDMADKDDSDVDEDEVYFEKNLKKIEKGSEKKKKQKTSQTEQNQNNVQTEL